MDMKGRTKKYIEIGLAGNLVSATMSNSSMALPRSIALSGIAMESTKLLDKKMKM